MSEVSHIFISVFFLEPVCFPFVSPRVIRGKGRLTWSSTVAHRWMEVVVVDIYSCHGH